jgi:DNA-binding MarR family transcriptional regulator
MIVTISVTILGCGTVSISVLASASMQEEPATGTIGLMMRLMRIVHRQANAETIGMRLKPFVALTHLRDLGGTASQQSLSDSLAMDANSVVLLLNELESDGFIERRRDPADRRRHVVVMTAAGERALPATERRLESLEDRMLPGLSADERATLRSLLGRAVEEHQRQCERAPEPAGAPA